jgi:Tol biopolymer transport system component
MCLLWLCTGAEADETILAPQRPALSPDGKTVVFGWRGDLWSASSEGGLATRLTAHAGVDERPSFSPNGKSIAFSSDRTGSLQLFTIGIDGRKLRQHTVHSEGARLQGWHPDGKSLLLLGKRDDYWYRAFRLYRKGLELDAAPQRLFNGHAWYGRYSPDGRRVAIMREGLAWTRKGYRGSRAAQIWVFDTQEGSFVRLSKGDHEERWPLWSADGKRLYFVSPETGAANLWRMNLDGSERVQLTKYADDGVAFPAISADGKTIVFRRLFDLYRYAPDDGAEPKRISLRHRGDAPFERTRRRVLAKADQAAFSGDGREVAFIAGGDVWVMDTELKEPRRVTNTPEEERDPAFSPDFGMLVFVSDKEGQPDIWRA